MTGGHNILGPQSNDINVLANDDGTSKIIIWDKLITFFGLYVESAITENID